MSDKKEKKSKDRVEKERRKSKGGSKEKKQKVASAAFSLLADDKAIDPTLSSLFAAKPTPLTRPSRPDPVAELADADSAEDDDTVHLGAQDRDEAGAQDDDVGEEPLGGSEDVPQPDHSAKRKRKRKHDGEEIEDVYMQRLERQEAKEAEKAASERAAKRVRSQEDIQDDGAEHQEDTGAAPVDLDGDESDAAEDDILGEDGDEMSPPPRHETEQAADEELSKANRTVFLGNVSTAAISSKSARKTLTTHLESFFKSLTQPGKNDAKYKMESIRFRSTAYAPSMPKKAAFATKQLMDATTKSTNAYVIYSSQFLAREAAKQLNGTIVLGRHLRVDEVAHPAKVDNKRCIFVGNLGFVDDESNIQAANEEEGKEKRKPGKEPADIEEGLWRTFGKCGTVESVRVIRDSTTRVGKGIAYVQFEDANAVEAALLYDGKKFPPMLPRKLRVSRAKAQKKNAKPGSGRPSAKPSANWYQRKVTSEEASTMGRAGKLYGKAASAVMRRPGAGEKRIETDGGASLGEGIKRPEAFVFEGHRASSKGGKAGLKLGGNAKGKKKIGKPTGRSAKRGAAFKVGGGKKARSG